MTDKEECAMNRRLDSLLIFLTLGLTATSLSAQSVQDPPFGRPDAVIDLATQQGADLVKGQWRYSDTKIVEVESRGPGADLKPSGAPIKTYDYTPHAGAADFDDSHWQVVDASTLDTRRSTGKLCFNWYRIKLTIPEKIGNVDPTGYNVSLV